MPDIRRGRFVLVHAGAAFDVEVDFRRLAEKSAGHHSHRRHRTRSVRQEGRAGRRYRGCQGLRKGRRQGQRARCGHRQQMARHCARHRVEGLQRENRDRGQPVEARIRRLRMMHGALSDQNDRSNAAAATRLVAAFERGFAVCNSIIVVFAAVALIAACVILSYSVLGRALFHSPNYWQDEAAVFLLVGATFMTAAYVQGQRGHIGIEAFVGLLSPMVNRIRLWLVDVASFLFCAFFAWKSWTLAHEAWVDGQVSNSMWSPPLAIPYVLMATGMTLLCVQILLQIAIPLFSRSAPR